ncbi:hypothetical protein [Corynebacterium pseudogenitalium]|uniref:hypothetical protein n=1 Tax=Corynebacterium pseudogenitalium TaxID=38303 RepID=UPI00210B07D6|nr:hypothetical protein [Corynebacterium pseudogenitalium]
MSINRAIASVSAIVIAATGLVACNDSEEKMEDKMDGSMAPSSEAMMSDSMAPSSEAMMSDSMAPSSDAMMSDSMAPSSDAMMSEDKMMEESK